MLNQTRKLDKFAAIEKAAARNQGKLESTSKEAELIHADLLEMNESIAEYVSGFQSGMCNEFTEIYDQVVAKAENLSTEMIN